MGEQWRNNRGTIEEQWGNNRGTIGGKWGNNRGEMGEQWGNNVGTMEEHANLCDEELIHTRNNKGSQMVL